MDEGRAHESTADFRIWLAAEGRRDEERQRTLLAFTAGLDDALNQTDRKGAPHGNRLKIQDWYQLETALPTQDSTNTEDSGISVDKDEEARTTHLKAIVVMRECELYLGSNPGRSNLSNNTDFHGVVAKYMNGKLCTSLETQEIVYKRVMFRNNLAKLASDLLDVAQIPHPNGATCAQFDQASFEKRLSGITSIKYRNAWYEIRSGILPRPTEDGSQGQPWEKPNWYIAAAITLDTSIKSSQGIELAAERLKTGIIHSNGFCDIIVTWRAGYKSIFQDTTTSLQENDELQ
jgi:hypothetical protein